MCSARLFGVGQRLAFGIGNRVDVGGLDDWLSVVVTSATVWLYELLSLVVVVAVSMLVSASVAVSDSQLDSVRSARPCRRRNRAIVSLAPDDPNRCRFRYRYRGRPRCC